MAGQPDGGHTRLGGMPVVEHVVRRHATCRLQRKRLISNPAPSGSFANSLHTVFKFCKPNSVSMRGGRPRILTDGHLRHAPPCRASAPSMLEMRHSVYPHDFGNLRATSVEIDGAAYDGLAGLLTSVKTSRKCALARRASTVAAKCKNCVMRTCSELEPPCFWLLIKQNQKSSASTLLF